MPVDGSFIWILAPETTAPLASVTMPETPAFTLACSEPSSAHTAATSIASTVRYRRTLGRAPAIATSLLVFSRRDDIVASRRAAPLGHPYRYFVNIKTFIICAYINV